MKVRRWIKGIAPSWRHACSASIAEPVSITRKGGFGISRFTIWLVCLGLLAGCKEDGGAPAPLTRVEAITTEVVDFAPTITLTGVVAAQVRTDLSFRISGKISERLVNLGEHVVKGQVLARLDPEEQQAELVSAQAGVSSAEAMLRQATAAFDRQKDLLGRGNTTRRDYDQAEAALRSAKAQLDQAHSDLSLAQDQLSYTELRADADGIITERNAEVGQVVAQAQPIYTLARDGPRDAVFNIHEWALANVAIDKGLAISLVADPAVTALGDVREISPAVNPSTETVAVKVALRDTPHTMTLGALVNGAGPMRTQKVVLVPWAALFEIDGRPAVWVIDPASKVVSLKPITVTRYTRDHIAVSSGLGSGEIVVSAGVQMLRPGQTVEIAGASKPTGPKP
jgi:RND family efflux transporter MFP subunit